MLNHNFTPAERELGLQVVAFNSGNTRRAASQLEQTEGVPNISRSTLERLIHEPDIRGVVNRLFKTRELDRKAEPRVPGGKAIRYRYFRRKLAGPIADLERVFHEEED
jgi:hypothetical protein